MDVASEIAVLPAPLQRALGADAPPALKQMAAKGVIPGAKPGDLVLVLALFADGDDGALARTATDTLSKLPPPVLSGALAAELRPRAAHALARHYATDEAVVEKLVQQPLLPTEALELLAEQADERRGELIATNEQRLLDRPSVIEKLYLNRRVRMSTANRLLELAVRNGVTLSLPAFQEAAEAIGEELIPEPTEEPTYDDVLFDEVTAAARALDAMLTDPADAFEADDEGEEQVREKFVPLWAKLGTMSITAKIRAATLGTASERMLLARDTNRLVAAAAVKSPLMRENEAAMISASRAVSEEVLRIIAQNREFTRNYQVKFNLVSNPRTPFTFASRLVPHLRDTDLRNMSRSKHVPGAVQMAAKQQILRKQSGKS